MQRFWQVLVLNVSDYDEVIRLTVKETRRHEPNPENRDVYEKTYKTYLNLYKSLEPMMRKMRRKVIMKAAVVVANEMFSIREVEETSEHCHVKHHKIFRDLRI